MGLAQKPRAQVLLNCCLSAVFSTKKRDAIFTAPKRGQILISALPDIATQPDMTAHWEAQLTDISQKIRRVISNLCLRLIKCCQI